MDSPSELPGGINLADTLHLICGLQNYENKFWWFEATKFVVVCGDSLGD